MNVASVADIMISVSELKKFVSSNVSVTDELITHLEKRHEECQAKRVGYWNHYATMKRRHNYISIPLLVVSSATGVVSAYQFSGQNVKITTATTALGGLSAILSSMQRYCSYSERAENAKLMAKSWGRLHRKIENTVIYIKSSATEISDIVFTKLVEEIQKDIDAVAQQADEMPSSLIDQILTRKTTSKIPNEEV